MILVSIVTPSNLYRRNLLPRRTYVTADLPVRNGSIRAEIRLGAIGYRLSNLRDQLQIFHVKLHPQSRPLVWV